MYVCVCLYVCTPMCITNETQTQISGNNSQYILNINS